MRQYDGVSSLFAVDLSRPKEVVIVATDCSGMALTETLIQLYRRLPPWVRIISEATESLDTLGMGMRILQYTIGGFSAPIANDEVLEVLPENMILFANVNPGSGAVVPRTESPANQRAEWVWLLLRNGSEVVACDAGYQLSFIRPWVVEARHCKFDATYTSQFGSRDYLPRVVAHRIRGLTTSLGDPYRLDSIQDVPTKVLARVDEHGNGKLTIRWRQIEDYWKSHEQGGVAPAVVSMNGVREGCFITDANFRVQEGELAFGRGSTHFGDPNNPCMELFVKGRTLATGGSAWERFGRPTVGTSVELTDLSGKPIPLGPFELTP